jgi:hypothetical protein
VDRTDDTDQPALGSLLTKASDRPQSAPVKPRAAQESTQDTTPTKSGTVNKTAPKTRHRPHTETDITSIAARIPGPIYTAALPLVSGKGKPSWGQLVAWTIQDRADEVKDEVVAAAKGVVTSRQPRGQNRQGGATTQITPRVTTPELTAIDQLRAAPTPAATRATRTAVIAAALVVAARNPAPASAGGTA